MKKIMFLISLFLIIFLNSNVKALEYNKGIIYEIYYQESQVPVFAKDATYESMDYNGIMIKSTADNSVYYCVAPEYYLPNFSEATTKSHYIYEGKNYIIKNTRLTENTYKRISLLAYYGYQYKNNDIDHTSKKWYGIAQVMMWRTLRPDINYVFKNSRHGTTNANLYKNEINELENLINNHDKVPSFDKENVKILKGETITLTDLNNVINTYEVKDNEYATFKIEGNKLHITGIKNGKVEVLLTKKEVGIDFKFYKAIEYQDLIIQGDVPDNPYGTLNIEVESGVLEIKKVDNDTNTYNENLKGTVFHLFDKNKNFIKDITITRKQENLILPYGKYLLKEVKASEGYNLNESLYEIEFNSEKETLSLVIPNSKIEGELILEKYKGGLDEEYILESNATFEIKDLNNNLISEITTDKNGVAKITLPYGKYKVIQKTGSEGYSFIDSFEVLITEEKVYKYELKNIKKSMLKVLKTDYSSKKVIKDTIIALHKFDNTLICEGKTDENGLFIVNNLDIGSYYIKEIKSSKYYRLNEKEIYFEIKEPGKIINLNITNERKEGTLKFLKLDNTTNVPLESAKIRVIFEETNEIVFDGLTNIDGEIILEKIQAGKYVIEEITPPYGYLLNKEKYEFEIIEEDEIIEVVMTNEKIKMPNTSVSYQENILLFISSLISLEFIIRNLRKNEIY